MLLDTAQPQRGPAPKAALFSLMSPRSSACLISAHESFYQVCGHPFFGMLAPVQHERNAANYSANLLMPRFSRVPLPLHEGQMPVFGVSSGSEHFLSLTSR